MAECDPMPAACFFERDGDLYRATELTRGPWDPDAQHGGPPAALLGRELDRAGQIAAARLTRVSVEILRPVPIAPLRVTAEIVRGGRRVELIEGTLSDEDGRELMRARGWRISTAALDVSDRVEPPVRALPGPDEVAGEPEFFPTGHDVGYHTAMEVRVVEGGFMELGPATAWFRMRQPLVDDEPPAPVERVLCAADSGNGISGALDYRRFVFINTDLTVNLLREPDGEWVCLDSVTYAEPDGTGLSDTALHDERGPIGRATQSLLVAAREQ